MFLNNSPAVVLIVALIPELGQLVSLQENGLVTYKFAPS
jgi:hypothetical protein